MKSVRVEYDKLKKKLESDIYTYILLHDSTSGKNSYVQS